MSFEKFNLSPELGMGLSDLKFEEPTPIQDECIPLILEGHDVIGAAQTGTGKTGAFVIPVIQKIMEDPGDYHQALMLSPTRELAQQIDEQIFALGYHTPITSATIIGGSDFAAQARSIRANVDIIVATPGRLLDQMNVTGIDFSKLKYLVLDEADRMLDMGFIPDVTSIVQSLPKERQTMLFSATMSGEVMKVVDRVMKPNPKKVEFEISKPVDSVDQRAYFVHPKEKLKLIDHIFDTLEWETCIIFVATRKGTDELQRTLKKRDIPAISIHGDRSQEERNEALRAFKNKKYPVIVATDVLSRGIDIDNVSIIINYDVPNTTDDYIHRVGRTGRYDKTGTAVTFVTNRDKKYFSDIRSVVGDQLTIYEDAQKAMDEEKSATSGAKGGSGDARGKESGKDDSGRKESSGKKEDEREPIPTDEQGRAIIDRSKLPERPSPSGGKDSEKDGDKKESDSKDADNQKSRQEETQEQETKKQETKKKEPKRQEEEQKKPEKKLNKQEKKEEPSDEDSKSSSRDGGRQKKESGRKGRSRGSNGETTAGTQGSRRENGGRGNLPDHMQPEIVEKAVSRNKRARKPAKGIWGIIKSFIPKITS
ncbi:MAG: DEAD/DEAH box helicase [Balneolaceae bacterium]|nr:DEAD/DEAH box helicase [Balneolaceae bacterium]